MGKKHYTDQSKISQYLFDDYLFNRELVSSDEVLKNVDLLIDNNLAIKISSSEDMSYSEVSKYKISSKFMCKYNKTLEKYKRKLLKGEFGSDFITPDTNPELLELSKCGLEPGIYYAYLGSGKHDDYAVMKVSVDKEDNYIINCDLYIIGYNCLKYKEKYFKLYDHYKEIHGNVKYEGIAYIGSHKPFNEVKFKGFDQMIFTDKEKHIEYIDNWVENIPNYYKYGITPKLSILLYGEPGTGKSTFTKAVAKHLGIDTVMSVSPDYFSDDSEERSRSTGRSYRYNQFVISIDDIDCVCKSRENDDSNENGQVLSNLLEFLDNPMTFYYKAKDGLYYSVAVVIATTNYIDKLDDAVKRYGRFDLKIEMNSFDRKQAEDMCAIYDLKLTDVYKKPIDKNFKISPSYLQALCLENIEKGLKKMDKNF